MAATLTTTFVPAPSCTRDFWMWSPGPYFILGPSLTSDCFPSGFNPARTAFYSPGICPQGYSQACSTVNGASVTTATCCPSGYGCNAATSLPWFSTLKCSSLFTVDETVRWNSLSGDSTVTVSRLMVQNFDGLNAYGIGIEYASSDFVTTTFSPPSTSTPSTGSSTSSGTPPATTHSGLATGTKAGIGIGVSLGVILIALGFWLTYRFGRSRGKQGSGAGAEAGPGPGPGTAQQQRLYHHSDKYPAGVTTQPWVPASLPPHLMQQHELEARPTAELASAATGPRY